MNKTKSYLNKINAYSNKQNCFNRLSSDYLSQVNPFKKVRRHVQHCKSNQKNKEKQSKPWRRNTNNSKLNTPNYTRNQWISRINHRKHDQKITKNTIENSMFCRNKSWNQRVSRKLQLCNSMGRSKQTWIYSKNSRLRLPNIKQNLKNLTSICRSSKKKIAI